MNRVVFSKGLDPSEVHLFHDSILKLTRLKETPLKKNPDFKLDLINSNLELFKKALEDYVKNVLHLLYLIKTYRKPLVIYGNGQMGNFTFLLFFHLVLRFINYHYRVLWLKHVLHILLFFML